MVVVGIRRRAVLTAEQRAPSMAGQALVENCEEAVFGAGSGSEGWEGDDEGAFGDVSGAGPALGG